MHVHKIKMESRREIMKKKLASGNVNLFVYINPLAKAIESI